MRDAVTPQQLAPVAAASTAITIWLASLGLVTTPYMLNRLGASAYAIFSLLSIVIAYLSNLELGFAHGTLRFLARARAEGDAAAESQVISTSLFVFVTAATVAAGISVLAAPLIVHDFANFPAELEGEAVDSIRLGAGLVIVTVLNSFAATSLQALGQFRTLQWNRLLSGTSMSVSAVALAALFQDVRAILAGHVVIQFVASCVLFIRLSSATSARLRPAFDRATFSSMWRYTSAVLLTGVAWQVLVQGPPTVLAGVARAAELAAFAVPAIVLQQTTQLVMAASTAFMPFASAESVGDDRSRLAAVSRSHMRLTILSMGPITAFLVVFASPILRTWVSDEFASNAADPLRLLAAAGLMIALGAPLSDVTRALGRIKWMLILGGTTALLSVTLAIPLSQRFEATGASLALLLAVTATTIPFVLLAAPRLLGIPTARLLTALGRPVAAVGLVGVLFWVVLQLDDGLLAAVITGLVVLSLYVPTVYRYVLEPAERETLAAGTEPLKRRLGAAGGRD